MRYYFLLILFILSCGGPTIINPNNQALLDRLSLSCIDESEIENTFTPVELFTASSTCVKNENYEQAVELYYTAMIYGHFDRLRVEDKRGQQVLTVLRLNSFGSLNESQSEAFQAELDRFKRSGKHCQFLKRLGKPTYIPYYMTKQTNLQQNGLIQNIDSNKLWQSILIKYADCSL